jgi:hypothetical protein
MRDVFKQKQEFRSQQIIHHGNKTYNSMNNLLISLLIIEQAIFKNLIKMNTRIRKQKKAQDKYL